MIRIGSSNHLSSALMTYPAFGYLGESKWRIHVMGVAWQTPVVFSMRQRMMIRMLGGVMQATPDQLSGSMFHERITPFLAEAEHRQTILLTINGSTHRLKKRTRRNGHFHDSICLGQDEVNRAMIETDGRLSLKYSVALEDQLDKPVEDVACLYYPHGLSVVSDIDDTIKDSSVGDRRELLANTFLREFRSIEGMSEVYRNWASLGASFHYVSSSPWQLYESLHQMQSVHDFPIGTMHLRNFRLRDHLLKRVILRRKGKATEISRLMGNMPGRDFVLVGDSGEKDPKIYLKMCRQFGSRIKGVFIRDISQRPLEEDIFRKLRQALPGGVCEKFETADDLSQFSEDLFVR